MSILLSDRITGALSILGATLVFLFVPASAGAGTCNVMSNSFHCMSGASKSKKAIVKKAAIKKTKLVTSYKVAAVRPAGRVSDVSPVSSVVKPGRKPVRKKARNKVRRITKLRTTRRNKRSVRKNGKLRTIGRRINAKSVRKLTRRSTRSVKSSTRKSRKSSRKASAKKGWRTRSKGLGYRTANRGVSTSCFPARLKKLLRKVSAHYGRKLVITSGYRSHRHNRRIGGARRSQHIHCTAADFYIPGVNKYSLARYLKRLPGRGGVGTYAGNRTVHLDVGPRRSWHWGGRKKRRYAKKRRNRRYNLRTVRGRTLARRHAARRRVARFRGTKS